MPTRSARRELTALLFYAILGVSGTWLLFALLMRDIRKAGLVASLAVLPFFTFGHMREPANLIARRIYAAMGAQDGPGSR